MPSRIGGWPAINSEPTRNTDDKHSTASTYRVLGLPGGLRIHLPRGSDKPDCFREVPRMVSGDHRDGRLSTANQVDADRTTSQSSAPFLRKHGAASVPPRRTESYALPYRIDRSGSGADSNGSSATNQSGRRGANSPFHSIPLVARTDGKIRRLPCKMSAVVFFFATRTIGMS